MRSRRFVESRISLGQATLPPPLLARQERMFEDRQGLTVQLERTDYDALAELAHERRASIGTVVREAIRTYLARGKKR